MADYRNAGLPKTSSVAKGSRICFKYIQSDIVFSPRGNVFTRQSDQTRGSFDTIDISEGCGRYGNCELKQFMSIAMGSANEVEYQLLLAKDLGYISVEDHNALNKETVEIRKMLASYIKRIAET